MKSKTTQRKGGARTAPTIISDCEPMPDSANRIDHIATSAYFKAEARGFVPGLELDDWLEAEAEYEAAAEER